MGNYKFVRDNLPDTYGILKLQDKILEIMSKSTYGIFGNI